MWGEPREGTEAHLVKKEVEKRKKIAKDKGLDRLIIDVYNDCLKYYPSWISSEKNKKWVISEVSEAKNIGEKYSNDIKFKFKEKIYKITRGDRWTPEFGDGAWYKLSLFLNDKKIFEVTEEETNDEYSTYHSPISVDAYINDDWVKDFNDILDYKKIMDNQSSIEFAENPERTRELKEAFGIDKLENINKAENKDQNIKQSWSIWSKWWFWVILIFILIALFD